MTSKLRHVLGQARARSRARRRRVRLASQARRAISARGARIARPTIVTPAAMPRMWPASSRASPTPQLAVLVGGGCAAAGLDPQRDPREVGAAAELRCLRAQRGGVAALGPQLDFDFGPLLVAVGAGELDQQAVDLRPRVAQVFADPDRRRGDVVGCLVAGDDGVDRGEVGEGVAELGGGDQEVEAGAGVARGAAGDRGAEDDPVGRVDGVEYLGRIAGDVGGLGAEDHLGRAFDVAVAGLGGEGAGAGGRLSTGGTAGAVAAAGGSRAGDARGHRSVLNATAFGAVALSGRKGLSSRGGGTTRIARAACRGR